MSRYSTPRAWSPERLRESLLRRFHARFTPGEPDDCWEWEALRQPAGYGILGYGQDRVYAHRLALELATGDPGIGKHALHACDNPPCVNPRHLSWGSNADNAADARAKGLRMKDTCRRGHPKTPENTHEWTDARGYLARRCRECDRYLQRQKNPNPMTASEAGKLGARIRWGLTE